MSESGLLIALFSVLFTLFVVLTERKLLAYAMRRMGPTLMGRNGAFQIALDLFKLLTKEIFLVPRPTTALAPVFLTLTYACQLLFSQNFIWGPSMMIFENLDSMILYHLILILFGNIFFYRCRSFKSITLRNYRNSTRFGSCYFVRYFCHDSVLFIGFQFSISEFSRFCLITKPLLILLSLQPYSIKFCTIVFTWI